MFQQFMLFRKRIPSTLLIFFLSIVIVTTFYRVFLTCRTHPKSLDTPNTFVEVSNQGISYSSKGEMRNFLVLNLWMSSGTRQCYQLAADSFSQALNIDPNHRGTLTNRAAAYISLEQYNDAINDYHKVLEINAQDLHARNGIALAYEKSGQLELAALKYEEAIQFMEISPYWLELHPDRIEEYRAKLEKLQEELK